MSVFVCECVCVSACVYVCVCVCEHVCVPPPLRLLITSSTIWTPQDWLNNFYSFYLATVVNLISRWGLSIDVCCEKQPNKHKLALYKLFIHFNSSLKWLYISSQIEHFNYNGG